MKKSFPTQKTFHHSQNHMFIYRNFSWNSRECWFSIKVWNNNSKTTGRAGIIGKLILDFCKCLKVRVEWHLNCEKSAVPLSRRFQHFHGPRGFIQLTLCTFSLPLPLLLLWTLFINRASDSLTSFNFINIFLPFKGPKSGHCSRCGLMSRGWFLPFTSWLGSCSQTIVMPGFDAPACDQMISGPFWQGCAPTTEFPACVTGG